MMWKKWIKHINIVYKELKKNLLVKNDDVIIKSKLDKDNNIANII